MIQRSEDDSRRHHCPAFKPDMPAMAAIADDGEFGVQQVADRILNVAKSVIKNDPARLDAVRAAVQDKFDEAARKPTPQAWRPSTNERGRDKHPACPCPPCGQGRQQRGLIPALSLLRQPPTRQGGSF